MVKKYDKGSNITKKIKRSKVKKKNTERAKERDFKIITL